MDRLIAHWYVVANPATLADAERLERLTRDAGLHAYIHHHAEGAACTFDCREPALEHTT